MKTSNIIITVLLLSLGIVSSEAQSNKKPNNKITVDFTVKYHDFGSIQADKLHYYEFEFTNKSNSPVKVKSLKRDCNINIPFVTRGELATGESGIIRVMVNPADMEGKFNKNMMVVFSSGKKDQSYSLEVKGKIMKSCAIPRAVRN